ncbi:Ornithine cyclodeaminase/mu-crystallin [Paraburkholderia ribeironis]|uniref:Ornithine cyclodeaminase/mu-crystallin n=1 Tax=Paraburkholderia ribeironis TaxID=1247936 RepID=A0A1N7RKF3_9BURK|nr:ornithine cyclodeaminase [Paraburkholderia ribeironis]SIT35598.1 Ornithine cyclodeaminase/mu-crystallin [Paraburkholderia ribeironis]
MSAVMLSVQDIRSVMTWDLAIEALRDGHFGARPSAGGFLLQDGPFSLFSRGVILPGYGAGVKVASMFPPNALTEKPLPTEDAIFVIINEDTKSISCILDGPEVTRWKTAADSALASAILSASSSRTLLVIGAGPVALALAQAHVHVRPSIERIMLWNRTPQKLDGVARTLLQLGRKVDVVTDVDDAVSQADIISSATGSTSPIIKGRFLKSGAHVDLVGGYRPDMREADDDVIAQSDVFVDFTDTAVDAGDIAGAIATGSLTRSDIKGDLFGLVRAAPKRSGKATVFKNAGGAHLDLLVALAAAKELGASV